jgi:hypothetical protein
MTSSPKANKDGNFIYTRQTADFDKASVFATVRTAMNMYRGDLGTLNQLYPSDAQIQKTVKYWDGRSYGALRVTTEAGYDANAYYNRSGTFRELKFFTFKGDNGQTIHTCRSSDVVTHEAGHAMLDIMHPEYFDANGAQTGGFHESFGDQTAIFWSLNHKVLCDKLIANTKGNLHQRDNNFLAALAEQFGKGLGMPNGLRNADDDLVLQDADQEVHAISTVYTGAIYDILASAYHEAITGISDPVQQSVKLYDVGRQFRQMDLQSVVTLLNPEPSFTDFAFALDTVAKQRIQSSNRTALDSLNWSSYINTEFTRRGIPVVSGGNLGLKDVAVKKVRLCGTVVQNNEKEGNNEDK